MTHRKTITNYLVLFTGLTTAISLFVLVVLTVVFSFYWGRLTFPSILTYTVVGIFVHIRWDGAIVFSQNGDKTDEVSKRDMVTLYFSMFLAFTLVLIITQPLLPLFTHFISPTISLIVGLYVVDNFKKISNIYKPQGHTVYPDTNIKFPGYNMGSVLQTGDAVDNPQYTSHGKAWWISDRLKNAYTDNADGQPTFRGLWIGGGFFHHKEGNLVSIAPPGTGKGAALIIPNLLWNRHYMHSFVVFDPKGTNACITARFRQQQGDKVIIIDPMNLQKANRATHGIPSASFNPLDHIEEDIFNGTAQIANLLIPDDPNGEKFWNQDARNLVQAILMHIMTDAAYIGRRNLITFYKLMLTADFYTLFEGMILNDSLDGAISDFASGFSDMMVRSEQTFSSVRSVANGSIKWLSNPALQACMKTSDFNPDELENGGISLYLCQPIQNKEGFATFSRLIVGFCLRANSKPAAKPKAWVYYLLDEFPTMGVFPEVIEALAFSREYRMRLWIFGQSLSQLDQIYKVEGRSQILGNARVLQAFGVTDQVTQEYISKRIGNTTVGYSTKSYSTGSNSSRSTEWNHYSGFSGSRGESRGTSNSEAFHGQPLIAPEQVQLDPNIITITEWGPMRLSRWQYWQQEKVKKTYLEVFNDGRADRNPNIEYDDEEFDEEFYDESEEDTITGSEDEEEIEAS